MFDLTAALRTKKPELERQNGIPASCLRHKINQAIS